MTPQERDVIAGIFDRLKQAANQPRDPEAETFIAERLREQPYAPYAMAQTVYVQEQALSNLNQQVESLQAQLRDAEARTNAAPQSQGQPQSGGFLSGIFGGGSQPRAGSVPSFPARSDAAGASSAWNTQPQGRPMQPQAQPMQESAPPGPWSNQPQQRAGGGFMASALTTAAGVAGGMVVGNMLMNAFKGESGTAQAAQAASSPSLADSVTAENAKAQPASDTSASDASNDSSPNQADYQQASHDDASYEDDPGFDDAGGDDDSWV